ncbi:hypothetical protein BC332_13114 [Capsicum chinense]|nr:hypothetical protein BC332_13114 [Capsicum chinense]
MKSSASSSDRYQKFSSSLGDETPSPMGVPVSSKTQFYVETIDKQPAMYRKKKNDVPWSTGLCDCMSDPKNCCITLWCPCITFGQVAEIIDKGSNSCALCQEYRELKNRGVDLSIGWHGNVERQNRGVIMPPTIEGGMNR